MPETTDERPPNRSLLVKGLAVLLALIGAVLALGGAWLAVLGGSLYYVFAGLGLLGAGFLLFRGRSAGVWLYVAVFVLTLLWALWEVGLDGWGLVPRVFGPAVLLILVLLALPLLSPARWRWRKAFAAVAGVVLLLVAGGLLAAVANRDEPGPLPPTLAAAMPDSAALRKMERMRT